MIKLCIVWKRSVRSIAAVFFFPSCCSRCKGQIGLVNNKHGCFPSLSSLAACFLCVSLKCSWIPRVAALQDALETESWHACDPHQLLESGVRALGTNRRHKNNSVHVELQLRGDEAGVRPEC